MSGHATPTTFALSVYPVYSPACETVLASVLSEPLMLRASGTLPSNAKSSFFAPSFAPSISLSITNRNESATIPESVSSIEPL